MSSLLPPRLAFWNLLDIVSRVCYLESGIRILIGGGNQMKEKVERVLKKIRPRLQSDGGDVKLVDVTDGIVKVKLTGACVGCPMATMTLKQGIEAMLKKEVPEVKEVRAV